MKILYHHRTRSKDGQYVHIEEMTAALRHLGHDVIVVAPPGAETGSFGSDARMVAWLKRSLPQFAYEIMEPAYSLAALVVGDGPARAALEARADAPGIRHRVTFTGVMVRDDVARYVAAFDIALQPGVVRYASPLKLFEYLALGKAIIGPAQPNLMEIFTDGQNAVLFDPNAADGMAGAIGKLTSDTALRQRIGENAKQTINHKQLAWRENARRAIELFKRIPRHA